MVVDLDARETYFDPSVLKRNDLGFDVAHPLLTASCDIIEGIDEPEPPLMRN
jgi:hypothetical protein